MYKTISKVGSFVKSCCRLLSSETPKKPAPKFIDTKSKIIYGGDVTAPTHTNSFGSLLFSRLMKIKNQDGYLQVCESTKIKMTARDLLEKAVAVARRLEKEDVKKGDIVALIADNSLNMNVAIAGIFFLGAVPAPLSTKITSGEFQIFLESVHPKIFFIDAMLIDQVKFMLTGKTSPERKAPKLIRLNKEEEERNHDIEPFEEFIKDRRTDVESFKPGEVEDPKKELALVMKALTHGKIGRLTGITHHNLNSLIARFDSHRKIILSKYVILMVQRMAWMSGMYSFLVSICFGAKLIVMNQFDEERFMQAIEEYKVTASVLFSSKAWQLYKYEYKRQYDVSSMSYLLTIDGSVAPGLILGLKDKLGINLRSSYALSEVTGPILQAMSSKKPGAAGKLALGVYGKIVSEKTNQAVGPNTLGIICFKGPTLTKGYINDKKSTRALFDKEGFLVSEMFGYYDEEGFFYVVDNVHNVIRHKNCDIAPRELEGIIKSLPDVRDVVVAGIQHPNDGYWPLAIVVLRPKSKLNAEAIIKHVDGFVKDCKRLRAGVIFITKIPRSRESGGIKRYLINRILSKYRIPAERALAESAT